MKDHLKVLIWLLFITSATSNLAASVYPEDERAIAPRIGQHQRVAPAPCEYSNSVYRVDLESLIDTYQFNEDPAQCFLSIRDNEYSPFVDETDETSVDETWADKSSEAFLHRARCCLIASESLSGFIPAKNKAEIVRTLHKLLQNRHALLNFVLPLAAGNVEYSAEFSPYFQSASSVQETFTYSLTNMVNDSLKTKLSQDLKDQFSTFKAWDVILSAFSAHNDFLSPFGGKISCCTLM